MKKEKLPYLIPESFYEYQKLPENTRQELSEYVLREAVIKITKNMIDTDDLNGLENAQEAFREFINQPSEDFPKERFLIRVGQSGMDKAEIFMDWLYDKYMKLAYTIHRRKI